MQRRAGSGYIARWGLRACSAGRGGTKTGRRLHAFTHALLQTLCVDGLKPARVGLQGPLVQLDVQAQDVVGSASVRFFKYFLSQYIACRIYLVWEKYTDWYVHRKHWHKKIYKLRPLYVSIVCWELTRLHIPNINFPMPFNYSSPLNTWLWPNLSLAATQKKKANQFAD